MLPQIAGRNEIKHLMVTISVDALEIDFLEFYNRTSNAQNDNYVFSYNTWQTIVLTSHPTLVLFPFARSCLPRLGGLCYDQNEDCHDANAREEWTELDDEILKQVAPMLHTSIPVRHKLQKL